MVVRLILLQREPARELLCQKLASFVAVDSEDELRRHRAMVVGGLGDQPLGGFSRPALIARSAA